MSSQDPQRLSQALEAFKLPVRPTVRNSSSSSSTGTVPLTTHLIPAELVPFHIVFQNNLIQCILEGVDNWFQEDADQRNPIVDSTFTALFYGFLLNEISKKKLGKEDRTKLSFTQWVFALTFVSARTKAGDMDGDPDGMEYHIKCDRLLTCEEKVGCIVESKGVDCFNKYVPKILDFAHWSGTPLVLDEDLETDERSIFLRVAIKMNHRKSRFGLLFDGMDCLVFQRMPLRDAEGTERHLIVCSDLYSAFETPFLKLLFGLVLGDDLPLPPLSPDLIPSAPEPLPSITEELYKLRCTTSRENNHSNLFPTSVLRSGFGSRTEILANNELRLTSMKFPRSCHPSHRVKLQEHEVWLNHHSNSQDTNTDNAIELEIWQILAVGGAGTVCEGFMSDLGGNFSRVAVKMFEKDRKEFFDQEVQVYRILEKFQGIIVPKIFGVHTYDEGNKGIIVMEFLEIMSNSNAWNVEQIPVRKRQELFDAMKKIHQCGIVHRDLGFSPGQNIYFGDEKTYIYDFSHASFGLGEDDALVIDEERKMVKMLKLKDLGS